MKHTLSTCWIRSWSGYELGLRNSLRTMAVLPQLCSSDSSLCTARSSPLYSSQLSAHKSFSECPKPPPRFISSALRCCSWKKKTRRLTRIKDETEEMVESSHNSFWSSGNSLGCLIKFNVCRTSVFYFRRLESLEQ